jgi:L-alanine-DL-glutamate epimerase-like enolase superfamily enzyme
MDAEGMVAVPTRPGIGVDVDTDMIESLTVNRHVMTSTTRPVVVA